MNRLLRGEVREWTSPNGTTYRRVWRDGREYWEQRYADGRTRSDEITPGVQESFDSLAAADDTAELERIFREGGLFLPGDPNAPRQN